MRRLVSVAALLLSAKKGCGCLPTFTSRIDCIRGHVDSHLFAFGGCVVCVGGCFGSHFTGFIVVYFDARMYVVLVPIGYSDHLRQVHLKVYL